MGAPTSPEPGERASALIDRVEIVSEPAANGTYLDGEELVFVVLVTSGEEVETTGEVFLIFDLGLASEPAALAASEAGRLEFRYAIRRGDYDGDGVSVPAGELMFSAGATLQVGGADLDASVPELPADGEHRVFARHSPGESLVFDTTLDRFPVDSLGTRRSRRLRLDRRHRPACRSRARRESARCRCPLSGGVADRALRHAHRRGTRHLPLGGGARTPG